uniref:AAA+ ATPase domain-containing protein n=1 Tax=Leersia perrieri TaxID=77586 RepID=A0A0D9X797_9ORYZ
MEAQGAMDSLLKKLTELLAEECARLKGVRREIRFLRAELNNMHALLLKCAAMEKPDIQVKAWTKELRELSHDIEDCLDEFLHGVDTNDHHRHGGIKEFFCRCARRLKTLGTRHRIANQIQELKARVVEVKEQRERYKLDDVAGSSNTCSLTVDPRISALFTEEAHLVGIDGPRDDLVSWLVHGEPEQVIRRKVLSIYGFAGLGKTTLANAIRRKIGKQFDCEALVSVSLKPDFKKILWSILSRITKKGDSVTVRDLRETWDESETMIIEKIREILLQKRYFIIIDDIWSSSAWDALKGAFPENNNGSRVITTTRIESIAKACCSLPSDRCYKIEPLSEFHSRMLLFKRVFGRVDGCPVQIIHVSDEILRKCTGLPLAIVSIASLLATRSNTKEQWEKVRASTGSVLQNSDDLEGMKTILSLSYGDLPHYIKPCLLYLSIFPEDYVIERGSLLRRWIAEGFVKEEYGQTVEDVAEGYFNELINRSMIIPMDIEYDGSVRRRTYEIWELEDEDLDLLAELPSLLQFQLWVVSLRKAKIVIKETGFYSLVTFHLWSGLPCLIFQEKSMPKLENLRLMFSACGAESYGSTHSGIEHLRSLKNVHVEIYTRGATPTNIEAAQRIINQEIAKHPNNLKTNITNSSHIYFGEVMNDSNVDEEAIAHFTDNNGDKNLDGEDNQVICALGSESSDGSD